MIAALIGWVIVGGILGALARLLVPGPDPMGIGGTIALGIAGQVIAGLVFYALFGVAVGWLVGLLVSIGLLLVIRRRRAGVGPGGPGSWGRPTRRW